MVAHPVTKLMQVLGFEHLGKTSSESTSYMGMSNLWKSIQIKSWSSLLRAFPSDKSFIGALST